MCELLGMECNVPTDITFSFTALSMRGGQTAPHADGWGVALYQGAFAQLWLEPTPACSSALARHVRDNPIHTLLAIAHVRKATVGAVGLENTHPFKRELGGRDWGPRGPATSCWAMASTCSPVAERSCATSSARLRSASPPCATRRCRSIFAPRPRPVIAWRSWRPIP
jgi:hypothetical protein